MSENNCTLCKHGKLGPVNKMNLTERPYFCTLNPPNFVVIPTAQGPVAAFQQPQVSKDFCCSHFAARIVG